MKRSCDVVTGAFGFIGSFLASKLSESKPILLTTKVRENESGLPYSMAEGLDSLNNLDVHVNNIFHLAHDFTNKTINGENINIKAIKDLIVPHFGFSLSFGFFGNTNNSSSFRSKV